jgi:ribosomal-protein-alanine N-acetyltransferase
MDDHFQIRPARRADIAAMARVERNNFSDPWSPEQLDRALTWPGSAAFVCLTGDAIVGCVIGRVVVDQAEILSLAVEQGYRRRGLGEQLLDVALTAMADRGETTAWLEVRQSNLAALALYQAHQFATTGTRRDYYRDPTEDALILRRDLVAPALRGASTR